jgi:lipoprotein LprG
MAAATAAGMAACGSSSPKLGAPELLAKAKSSADAASGAHFVLTSSGVSTSGTNITGGEGDLIRPQSLQGSFSVTVDGFVANVKVASVGSDFEALTPFSAHFVKTDPSKFGLTNPADLLDPTNGLTSLLVHAQNPQLGRTERINGELLDTVTFTVPGTEIPVLPDAAPSRPVSLEVAVDPSSYQLRVITLTGPLTSATSNSTFVLTLSDYNEHVTVTLPPTS